VSRPALEVADIFRDHGPAWRRANAGHVSRDQLKVMTAIERCRTAALGGHVMRCEDCAHEVIAYNSCRNRHCPKCQGAAAREWLAERESELLPVPYFHVVFTLPARIAAIAYHNKAVVYDLLFKASSEAVLTIAADPKHLGARIGITAVLHTWGSTMTHHPHVDRAGRRHRLGWEAMAVVPVPFLAARAGARQAVPGADACQAPRRPQGRTASVLRPACPPRRAQGLRGLPGAPAQDRVAPLVPTANSKQLTDARESVDSSIR
jgi:hypothetical protein